MNTLEIERPSRCAWEDWSAPAPCEARPSAGDFTRLSASATQGPATTLDLRFFDPKTVRVPRDPNPTVLFHGEIGFARDVDALCWYFQEIHERLFRKVPDIKVLIVGKAPPPEILAHALTKGVTVTGAVADIRPIYRRAWMQIVPLRQDGDVRWKIAESMAMGTPVISTSLGAQEPDLIPEYNILLADDAAEFAAQTAEALLDPALRQCIERAGKETVQERGMMNFKC